MKNYKDRPKYKKLLLHPFILKYEREEVDVGAWYRSHLVTVLENFFFRRVSASLFHASLIFASKA